MITITGGKLTTWRRMAKLAVDRLVDRDNRDAPCRTHEIPLGYAIFADDLPRVEGVPETAYQALAGRYGHAAHDVLRVAQERGELAQPIVPGLPDLLAEAAHAARKEQVTSVADVLFRRTRLALLAARDLHEDPQIVRRVAEAVGRELEWDAARVDAEVEAFATRGCGRGHRGRRLSCRDFAPPLVLRLPMRPLLPVAVLAALALPATAHAAWFPADQLDGPTADITSVGDVDVAREGVGAAVYLKRDGGQEHVFLARLFNGGWEAPIRIDNGIVPKASQPVVAAANPDRLAVAWVSDGSLFTTVRTAGAQAFGAPKQVAQGGVSDPSIDISINGTIYVSYTQNGDVRIARAPRDSQDFAVIPTPVDFDAARDAGTGDQRSRIAVSADGSAVVVWGEDGSDGRGHVFGRRIFELRLSTVIEDLTLTEFEGRAAGDADRPEIDIEDDSSFAQAAFRQQTVGGARLIGRRLVGSQFDPPFALDGGQSAVEGRTAITGRGEGVTVAATTTNQVIGGTIWNNKLERVARQDSGPGGVAPKPLPLVGENENGAWSLVRRRDRRRHDRPRPPLHGDPVPEARARGHAEQPRLRRRERRPPGMAGGSTRVSDHVVVFVQGTGGEKRLVAAVHDDPPARPLGQNTTGLRRLERFKWAPARDLWGQTLYRVMVDEEQIAETTDTELPVLPGMVSDGTHSWYVIAVDRRGQTTAGPPRTLRIDNTPPLLRASIGRKGRRVGIRIRRFADRGTRPSGISRIVVSFGNGRRISIGSGTRYTYPRGGSYRLRVSGYDRAGNRTDITRTFNIG